MLVNGGAYLVRRFFTECDAHMETQLVAGTCREQIGAPRSAEVLTIWEPS